MVIQGKVKPVARQIFTMAKRAYPNADCKIFQIIFKSRSVGPTTAIGKSSAIAWGCQIEEPKKKLRVKVYGKSLEELARNLRGSLNRLSYRDYVFGKKRRDNYAR